MLRRSGPVSQQRALQLDVQMQITQTSERGKVRLEGTSIQSEIKLKSFGCFNSSQSIKLARNCVVASRSCAGKPSDGFIVCSKACSTCPRGEPVCAEGSHPSNRKKTQRLAAAVITP